MYLYKGFFLEGFILTVDGVNVLLGEALDQLPLVGWRVLRRGQRHELAHAGNCEIKTYWCSV